MEKTYTTSGRHDECWLMLMLLLTMMMMSSCMNNT